MLTPMHPVPDPFTLAIVGSRDYPLPWLVRRYIDRIPPGSILAIYSGGARGVDTWAATYARRRGFTVHELLADWHRHGRRAGFLRNHELVTTVDQVVAFWDGSSSGTAHTIQLARLAGKLRRVFGPAGHEITFPPIATSHADVVEAPVAHPARPTRSAPELAAPDSPRRVGRDRELAFAVLARAATAAGRCFSIHFASTPSPLEGPPR